MIVRNKPAKGFSLFELLVAMSVLLVLMAIVLPPIYRSYSQHRAMDLAMARSFDAILTARSNAIRNSAPYVYQFEPGSNRQIVFPLDQPQLATTFLVPKEIKIQAPRDAVSSNSLIYREDGSTEGAELILEGPVQRFKIQVSRHLGMPQTIAAD